MRRLTAYRSLVYLALSCPEDRLGSHRLTSALSPPLALHILSLVSPSTGIAC